MKKLLLFVFVLLFSIFASIADASSGVAEDTMIDKIKLTDDDIPQGFVYGKIPDFAKKVLQENPWKMNKSAIDKLTEKIYPDGNPGAVKNIYVSIYAKEDKPYGDDIVCYIILFKDNSSAGKEIGKLKNYASHNSDRVVLIVKKDLAVFLHVDDIDNFDIIKDMGNKISTKIDSI